MQWLTARKNKTVSGCPARKSGSTGALLETALHSAGALIKLIFGIIGTLLLVVLCTGIIFSVLFANYLQHDVLTQLRATHWTASGWPEPDAP